MDLKLKEENKNTHKKNSPHIHITNENHTLKRTKITHHPIFPKILYIAKKSKMHTTIFIDSHTRDGVIKTHSNTDKQPHSNKNEPHTYHYIKVGGAFNKFPDFFVQAFKIVVDS